MPSRLDSKTDRRLRSVFLAGKLAPGQVLIKLALLALLVLFLWLTIKVDLVLFGGILLAICLRTAADRLSLRTGFSGGWALLAVVAAIVIVVLGLAWLFASTIAGQITELSQRLPQDIGQLVHRLRQVPIVSNLLQQFDPQQLLGSGGVGLGPVLGFGSAAVEAIAGAVVIAFIGIYVAADAELYRNGLLRLVPPARRVRAADILDQAASMLWHWMLGRLFSMTTLGILTGFGLWALGVPAALGLGLLAATLIFVPYLGAVVSAVPSVIMALAIDARTALYVIALYIGIHIAEGYILVPLVQRRVAHLPPALTLAAQLILGVLAGLVGLLFATPLVAAAMVLVRTIYVEDTLGDRAEDEVNLCGPITS
jgi:predicted PurR-regulated permease PerM